MEEQKSLRDVIYNNFTPTTDARVIIIFMGNKWNGIYIDLSFLQFVKHDILALEVAYLNKLVDYKHMHSIL